MNGNIDYKNRYEILVYYNILLLEENAKLKRKMEYFKTVNEELTGVLLKLVGEEEDDL